MKSCIRKIFIASMLVLGLPAAGMAQNVNDAAAAAVRQCLPSNQPVGAPKGIFPGRVAWSHAPGAASWDMKDPAWYADACNDQEACYWLMDQTLRSLTGASDAPKAWAKIFRHFNSTHGRGKRGYKRGETVTIKINNNNTASHADSGEINASPQMVYALLKSLTQDGGVPQRNIIVAEPSRYITDYLFDKCHKDFPDVRYVDNAGGDGREKSTYTPAAMHYSGDNGQLATGIAEAFTSADYVIDMALLKGHVGQGVTLCGKNWYGAFDIDADWRKNFHNNFDQSRDGTPKYMTFVDFMGHPDLGGKCMLWLIDGLYGCRNVGGAPGPKWSLSPFDGDWPCSLLGSLDPVAVDMVGLDLLTGEFPDMPDVDYSDMYLVEAAMAGAPSHTRYCPAGKGKPLTSLGVAEHWNNPRDKKYSGKKGIDLVYVRR